MENDIEKRKTLIEHLKMYSERYCVNEGKQCIVDRVDLQLLLLDYMDTLQKVEEMQHAINVYRSYKDCDEEFEL